MNRISAGMDSTIWLAQHLPLFIKGARALTAREIRALTERITEGDARHVTELPAAEQVCQALGVGGGKWRKTLTEGAFPMLAMVPGAGCMVVYGKAADGAWLLAGPAGRYKVRKFADGSQFLPNCVLRHQSLWARVYAMFRTALCGSQYAGQLYGGVRRSPMATTIGR